MERSGNALSLALARLARGDRSAQRAVFDEAWPLVRGFCRRMLQASADGEDAAQRALIRLFEQASHYDVERDGLAWALEIALWECRTALRSRSRSKTEELSRAAYDVADAAPTAEAVVERRDVESALAEVLGALSAVERQALLDGLTGVTWRKRRQRALIRLKLLWSAQHE
ncbi:MAG: sigma-70 family RNA polymerase sigma factor [Archangiaceae bacterium]|nr:sigma-70 family RNA polymerase sigma factor [Archangiaceae bacterium]